MRTLSSRNKPIQIGELRNREHSSSIHVCFSKNLCQDELTGQ
jgi:hypothetical protein